MVPNLANLLIRSAKAYPGLPALALGCVTISDYAMLANRVARLASGLRDRLALRPNDRVALVMRNCPAYIEVLFSCWHAGLAAVPINVKLHSDELAYIFQDAGARCCFVTADTAEGAARAATGTGDMHVVDVGTSGYAALAEFPPMAVTAPADETVAWLFYTSGTTGRPKGVMLTHRNLLAMTLNYFSDVDVIAPGDAIVHAAPMSHGSGMYILPHVAAAACNVAPDSGGFEPAELFSLFAVHRGVSLFAAPTMVKRLVAHGESAGAAAGHLKTIVYGGGPMYVADLKRAMRVLGEHLAQIYGQGESPMTITAMSKAIHADASHPRYEQRLASVGLPFTGVEVRVADENDRPLPAGEVGEILVRGDTVMAGYWRNRQASAATLRNGWLHTGDVGSLDEEGFLTLKDRSKDVIISGGSNIYPREVEEVLLRHPAVIEVSVVGAADAEWGESVVAFVVSRPGAPATAAEIDAHCLAHIARFKRPKRYVFVAELPKNQTGKVLKTELRKLLA